MSMTRNATITKIRPRDYMVDLYENGSWIDGRRGGADREQVRQLEAGTTAIHYVITPCCRCRSRSTH